MDNKLSDDPTQSDAFREALGCFATGVTVVTAMWRGQPAAITVNSFASVSLDPPLVLWNLDRSSLRVDTFGVAERYSIHVMAEDQLNTALRFANDGLDFGHVDWSQDDTGRPILKECLARFDCTLFNRIDAGDHMILVGRVEHMMHRTGKGLIFKRGQFGSFSDLI